MGFTLPPNLFPLGLKMMADVSELMGQAEAAFSGQPGSGEKKKAFVMDAAKKMIEDENLINADLTTPEQEAAALDTVDKGVEFIFAAANLAKMFTTPKV